MGAVVVDATNAHGVDQALYRKLQYRAKAAQGNSIAGSFGLSKIRC